MGLSLRTKWMAALLVTGAAPLALFAYRTVDIQHRGLENAEQQLEVSVIDHVSTLLDDDADEAADATHRVGLLLTEGKVDEDERIPLARDIVAHADVLAEVAVYDADGSLIDAITRNGTKAATTRPAKLVSLDASRGGTWQVPSYSASGVTLRYLEPVERDGVLRAWVLGTLDVGALGQRLVDISRDRFVGRMDGVLLLDRDATVVVGGGALSTGVSLRDRDLFAGHVLAQNPFATDFAFSTEFAAPDGEAMSGSVRSLPHYGWAVVVRRTRKEAYAALADAQRALAIAAGGFVVLSILLGAWLAARTTRPVRKLVALTRAYGARRFDAKSEVHTGDELEELGGSLEEMAKDIADGEREIARRAIVQADLSRYLPGDLAKSIADGKATMTLGGERRRVTIVFADVVAFTTFAEGANPERAVAFLNELFSILTEVVFRHGGTVDKFLGDCIMAIFGAPTPLDDHAKRALAAAEDMHRFVEAQAPAWKKDYGVDVRLGIGVNTGEALVGNLGSETRMEYTAIGDVVNVAARLEGLARPGQTLLTADVVSEIGDAFAVTSLGEHPLRGKRQSTAVFELQ